MHALIIVWFHSSCVVSIIHSDLSNPDAMQGSGGGKGSASQMDWWETSTAMKKEYEEQIKVPLYVLILLIVCACMYNVRVMVVRKVRAVGGKGLAAQMDWWETSTAMKKEYEEQIKACH